MRYSNVLIDPASFSTGRRSTCRAASLALLLVVWLAGCGARPTPAPTATPAGPPVGSCSLDLAAGAGDEAAIRAVLKAESDLMVAQAIDPLMALWADSSQIIDAKNSPDDTTDDQTWLDKDAVRHRYVRIVFPGAPAQAAPADLQIQLAGTTATVRATTTIGREVAPGGDRWELVKQGDCWLIQSLTYNLETR